MDLIIKSLSGVLEEDDKKVIRKKMLWFDGHLPNNAVLTVGVKQKITKKSNQAYEIFVHLNAPQTKRVVYVRVAGVNLMDALDQVKEKIERIVLKKKDKREIKFKFPKLKLGKRRKIEQDSK